MMLAALFRIPSALTVIPWLLPGAVISVAVGVLVAPRVAQALRTPRPIAWLFVVGVGVIVAATLTPMPGPLMEAGTCDFERVGVLPLSLLMRPNEASLNVLLFVPLGLSIGLLPWASRTAWIAAASIASPFVIEAIQSFVVVLGRGCQSADVFDNLTGLLIGMAIGAVARLVLGWPIGATKES